MKKALFITRHNPFGIGGGAYASKCFMNIFIDIFESNIDICLADICIVPDEFKHLNIYKVKERSLFKKIVGQFTLNIHRFTDYIQYLVKNNTYTHCIFDGSICSANLIQFVKCLGLKTIVIHHNFEPEYHIDNKTIESFKGLLSCNISKIESTAFKFADLNLFLTTDDLNSCLKHYGVNNGVNHVVGCIEPKDNEYLKIDYSDKRSLNIVISGSLNAVQSEKGILDFIENIYPLIVTSFPNLRLLIAGKKPSIKLSKICDEHSNIELIADPRNMFQVLARADIYVCPIKFGSGLKLRIMDGLRVGLPIFAHEKSLRGYDSLLIHPFIVSYNDNDSDQHIITKFTELINGNWSRDEIRDIYLNEMSYNRKLSILKSVIDKI